MDDTRKIINDFSKHHIRQFENGANLSRRAASIIALGGSAAIAALGTLRASNAMAAEIDSPIKLTVNWYPKASDDQMKFLREVGYKYARCYLPQGGTVEELKALKKRYADFGVSLDSVNYLQGGKHINQVMLNLEGRDKAIKLIQDWIRINAQAGFKYVGSNFMLTGVWSSARVDIRGGAISRRFDPASPDARGSADGFGEPGWPPKPASGINALYYGRPYGYDELMANFKKYWVGEILPVLQENDVTFGFHPDDPPVFKALGGVDRLNNNYGNINKFFDAFGNDRHMQMMMCIGTWNEGGTELMGASVEKVVKEFWTKRRFQEVQFRSVSNGPINGQPHFDEVFQDSGEYDMYKVAKILVDNGYDQYMHLDHTPDMAGAPYTYAAYAAGFMRACIRRAQNEPKVKDS